MQKASAIALAGILSLVLFMSVTMPVSANNMGPLPPGGGGGNWGGGGGGGWGGGGGGFTGGLLGGFIGGALGGAASGGGGGGGGGGCQAISQAYTADMAAGFYANAKRDLHFYKLCMGIPGG